MFQKASNEWMSMSSSILLSPEIEVKRISKYVQNAITSGLNPLPQTSCKS